MTANIHDTGEFIHEFKLPGVVAQIAAEVDADGRIRRETNRDEGTMAIGELYAGAIDAAHGEPGKQIDPLGDIDFDMWVEDLHKLGALSNKNIETAAACALFATAGSEFESALNDLLLQNSFYAWKYTYRVCWRGIQNQARKMFKAEAQKEFEQFFDADSQPYEVSETMMKKLPWPVMVKYGMCPNAYLYVKSLRAMFPNAYRELEELSDTVAEQSALTKAEDAAKVIAAKGGYTEYRSVMEKDIVDAVDSFLVEAGGTGSVELPRKFPKKPVREFRQAAEVVQFAPPQQMQPEPMQPPPPKYNTAIVEQEKAAIIEAAKAEIAARDEQIQQAAIALQNAANERQQIIEAISAPVYATNNDMAVDVGAVSSLPAGKYTTDDKIAAIKKAKDQLTKEYQAELERKDRALAAVLQQAQVSAGNKYNTSYVDAKLAEMAQKIAEAAKANAAGGKYNTAFVKQQLSDQYNYLDKVAAQNLAEQWTALDQRAGEIIAEKEASLQAEIAKLKALLAKQAPPPPLPSGTQYTPIPAPKQTIIYDKTPPMPTLAAPSPAAVVAPAPAPAAAAATEFEKAQAIAQFWWKKHPRAEKIDKSKQAKTVVTNAADYVPNKTDFQGLDTK